MSMMVNPARFAASGGGGGGGPPTFIAASTMVAVTTTPSIDVPYPAGKQVGDIAIIHVLALNGITPSTFNTPSGWNLMQRVSLGNIAESGYDMVTYWRRLDGSEGSTVTCSQTDSQTGSGSLCGIMSIFRGCVATGTPYEALTSAHDRFTDPHGSSMVTTGPNRLGVNIYSNDYIFSSTPGSGWTEAYDQNSAVGPDETMSMNYKLQATAGTIGVETLGAGGAGDRWASVSFALITA